MSARGDTIRTVAIVAAILRVADDVCDLRVAETHPHTRVQRARPAQIAEEAWGLVREVEAQAPPE